MYVLIFQDLFEMIIVKQLANTSWIIAEILLFLFFFLLFFLMDFDLKK